MTITYYVALSFLRADDGSTVPGEAIECPNAATAILRAEILSQGAGNVGAIAFSRTGGPDVGKFKDAIVLSVFSELTIDPTMLC